MSNNLKILLINPAYLEQLRTTTKDVHRAMEGKPPLGILSVGTYLKQNTDFEVRLLDNQLEALSNDKLNSVWKEYFKALQYVWQKEKTIELKIKERGIKKCKNKKNIKNLPQKMNLNVLQ